jgi:two-component system response regulator FixJ
MTIRNIFIIDDDDAVRASLHRLLSTQSDLVIRSFRSGDAFLAQAAELENGVAMIDFDMPGASGLDVLDAIKTASWPFVGIILTGHGNVGLAVKAMKAGALDFLEKPCEPALLLEVVERAFEKLEAEDVPIRRIEGAKTKISLLSGRETDVLLGLIEGQSNKAIAHILDISPRTVEAHRASVMDKLEVRSLSEALRIAFSAGLFPPE